jgi:hypothetical protein
MDKADEREIVATLRIVARWLYRIQKELEEIDNILSRLLEKTSLEKDK